MSGVVVIAGLVIGRVEFHATDPRGDPAVIEADAQIVLHLDRAFKAFHATHQVRVGVTGRQEVRDPNSTGGGAPFGFQDKSLGDVPARDHLAVHRGELPATVVFIAQDRAEHRGGIEARETQPVHAAVSGHQRSGVEIGQ